MRAACVPSASALLLGFGLGVLLLGFRPLGELDPSCFLAVLVPSSLPAAAAHPTCSG